MLILVQFKGEYPDRCVSAFLDSMYCVHTSRLAKQILPLILVQSSLLGKVQTAHVKRGMKMKALHMHPFYSLRAENNQAVICRG